MQKYILFTCITLITAACAMERMEIAIKVPCELSHQSPEITRIHTQKYLGWLEEQAQQTATNPDHRPAHSYENINIALQNVGATLNATNNLINSIKNKSTLQRCYGIALADPSSFAGNEKTNSGDLYAAIPIAAAYALKTNLFKRILIINEDLDQNPNSVKLNRDCENAYEFILQTNREHHESGNGSLYFSNNNPELSALFNDKIITRHAIHDTPLWNFLHYNSKNIDLVFYNIDSAKKKCCLLGDTREPNILALFQKCIPVVFIISGADHNASMDIINYIQKTACPLTYSNSLCKLHYPYGTVEHNYHH